jgi:glycolate oxidase iron-sulfur subunit
VDAVVTYHDSCHLKKSMKVFREPREILRAIPGVIFKEMASRTPAAEAADRTG